MSLSGWVAKKVATHKIRDVAEGKMGPELQKLYWWLVGKKRITGLIFGFIAAGLYGTGHLQAAETLGVVASILVSVGLLDAAWRATPPVPPVKK